MTPDSVFKAYDCFLLLSGNQIFVRNRISTITANVISIISLSLYFSLIAICFVDDDVSDLKFSAIQLIAEILYTAITCVNSLMILFNRQVIRDLLTDILRTVRRKDRRRLRLVVCLLTLVTLAATIFDVQNWFRRSLRAKTAIRRVQTLLSTVFVLNNWILCMASIYLVAVLGLRYSEENRLTRALNAISRKSLTRDLMRRLLLEGSRAEDFASRISHRLGFCPLLLFGYLFLLTPAQITSSPRTHDLVFLTVTVASAVMILLTVDSMKRRSQGLRFLVKQMIFMEKEFDVLSHELVQQLDDGIRLTAYNLFDVDIQTLLSFGSSLITFTILFKQLDITVY